jgi:hypothetical protein
MAKMKVKADGTQNAYITVPFDKAFNLVGYGADKDKTCVVLITQELTDYRKVSAAWALALQETAKGLEIPDYQAAADHLMKNNPGWIAAHSEEGLSVGYNLKMLKRYG